MSGQKLPVLPTVRNSYRSLFVQAEAVGEISRFWAALALGAFALSSLLIGWRPPTDAELSAPAERLSSGERVEALTALSEFAVGIGIFAILVRWHRIIIRNTAPAETRKGVFGGGVLYFVRSIFLTCTGAIVFVVGGLLPSTLSRQLPLSADQRWYFAAVTILAALIAAVMLVGRWSLILPAAALGDHSVNLRRSWALTHGNSWRIFSEA